MSFTLRPEDQVPFRDACRHALRHARAVIGVAACGFGKGVVTQDIVRSAVSRGKHVLFLVYGIDRVQDMHKRLTAIEVPHGVLMGGTGQHRWHSVQVASVSTLFRMRDKPLADLIVIDECHLAMSPTFRAVLNCYPNAKILGLTATPILSNGKALGKASGGIFEAMVKGPSAKELIAAGSLVGARVIAPPPPEKLKGLKKKRTGEYDENEGAAICDNQKVIGDIVDHWKRHASDCKAVAFGFHQAHAFHIAEQFRASGVNFAYVDANTPEGNSIHETGTRKWLWDQYDHGDLVGIASCNIPSIGWDHSICKCLIFGSKIGSFPMFHQRLGRGSRPHKGYDHFKVHDHTGSLYEHEEMGMYFDSDIDWQLDSAPSRSKESDNPPRVSTCNRPVLIPVVPGFRGPVRDGYMLPCLMTFPAGQQRCPYCGIPFAVQSREVEVEAGELQEVTPERKRSPFQIAADEKKKMAYLELLRTERNKGYKSNWAVIQYMNKYGYPPGKGWKAECVGMLEAPEEAMG